MSKYKVKRDTLVSTFYIMSANFDIANVIITLLLAKTTGKVWFVLFNDTWSQ